MGSQSNFRSAFWAGVAAPVMLFAPVPNYAAFVSTLSPSQSFGVAGYYLSQAMKRIDSERPARAA
jgi:hypothetical protein